MNETRDQTNQGDEYDALLREGLLRRHNNEIKFSVKEMKSIEREADSNGLTFDQMMENAGQGLAEVINDLLIEDSEREISG